MSKKQNLATIINNNYQKGVKHGWNAFVLAFFIGVYNVNIEKQIIPEEKLLEFCDSVETELIRIFRDEMHNNPDDVDALVVAAMNAREKSDSRKSHSYGRQHTES